MSFLLLLPGAKVIRLAGTFKNTIIKAPAGSGKTTKLVERYLDLLKSGKDISQIVAITFTNKATGEMQERILRELLEQDIDFLRENYFSNYQGFRISTIHSFLRNLLSIVDPFQNPSSEVVSESEDERLFNAILYEKIRTKIHSYRFLKNLKRRKLQELLKTMREQLPISYVWAENVVDFVTKSKQSSHSRTETFFLELAAFFLEVYSEYKDAKHEKGIQTFSDMITSAYTFIKGSGSLYLDLMAAFNERITAILLDEFQDTDYLQWEVIRTLSEDWLSGVGLREVEDASIFLIGDPMQSIYGFRGAEPRIMQEIVEEFKSRIEESEDGKEHFEVQILDKNYRSVPAIIDFTNEVFKRLFSNSEVCYDPFEAVRKDDHGIGEVVVAGMDEEFENGTKAAEAEAAYIARKIKEIYKNENIYELDPASESYKLRKINYGDIAILVKNRGKVASIERALVSEQIPFVSEESGFSSIKPFEFLRNFFMLFDFSKRNAVLPKLFSLIGESSYDYRDFEDFGRRAPEPLSYIYTAFLRFKERASQSYYFAFKEAIRMLEPLLNYAFGDSENAILLEHSLKLFEEIFFGIEKEGISSLHSFSDAMEKRINELVPKIGHELDAVTIMTIHKAKGLEFPVVFVASLFSKPKNVSFDFFVVGKDHESELLNLNYALYLSKSFKDDAFIEPDEELEEGLKKYSKAVSEPYITFKSEEEKRLFYVAFTRAKDRLYVCMPRLVQKGKKNKKGSESDRIEMSGKYTTGAYNDLFNTISEIKGDYYKIENLLPEKAEADLSQDEEDKSSESNLFKVMTSLSRQKTKRPEKEYDFSNLLKVLGYEKRERQKLKKADPPSVHAEPDRKFSKEIISGKLIHEAIADFGLKIKTREEVIKATQEKLKRSGLDVESISLIVEALQKALDWLEAEVLKSKTAYFELPYLLIDGESYREGRIDLLYEEAPGVLKVVDFKFEKETGEMREEYKKQLETYCKAVKTIFNADDVVAELKYLKE